MLPAHAFSSPLKADSWARCYGEEINGGLDGWGDVLCLGSSAPHGNAKFGLMDREQRRLRGRRALLSR